MMGERREEEGCKRKGESLAGDMKDWRKGGERMPAEREDCREEREQMQGEREGCKEAGECLLNQIERLLPKEIERRSFEIIEEELLRRGICIPEAEKAITKRVIHTTADFEYGRTLVYTRGAVGILEELVRKGADIVTDTNMALAGINKKVLAGFGGQAHCFMADEDVAREADRRGMTRAAVSMERAAKIGKPVIAAVGNAPTALVRLYELALEGGWRPAFVIGVPVGFVNVEAAKELILSTDIPCIVNRGRKGGSSVAAAVCNGVLYGLAGREREGSGG